MNGAEFERAVRRYVLPVLEPYGFQIETNVSGRMYSVEFSSTSLVVSVSYEPGDDYMLVVVFTVKDGVRSDIDDRKVTPRLSDLNDRFLCASDADELSHRRTSGANLDPEERHIQRLGAELGIVLPRYMHSLGKHSAAADPATPSGASR